MLNSLSIAVVHDFLYCYSGAERVLEQILNVYPHADLFALFDFLPDGQRSFIRNKKVNCSFVQRLPFARRKHRMYLPVMPLAVEQLDVSGYDVVISSSYLAAKGVLVRPDQLHVCYCHTPVRYAWDLQNQYLNESGLAAGVRSVLARLLLHYIRNWDVRSANSVDVFVTNSDFVGRRVRKTYRRDSTTIYPPVDFEHFDLETRKGDYYLTASRLVPYKRVDLIVEAFARMPGRKLVVVGEGPEFAKIQAAAPRNVELLGYQPAERLRDLMRRAKAFVFAAEEDFGIVPVEAQACGTPVVAFGRGGALESVTDGRSGLFFHEQSADAIAEAVSRFEQDGVAWAPAVIRAGVQRFSADRFRREFRMFVEEQWQDFQSRQQVSRVRLAEPYFAAGPADVVADLPEAVVAAPRVAAG